MAACATHEDCESDRLMSRIKVKEWQRLVRYGHMLCRNLELKGIHARIVPYKGEEATSGLYIQALDCSGHVIKGYATGTSRYNVMMMALVVGAKRLERECAK